VWDRGNVEFSHEVFACPPRREAPALDGGRSERFREFVELIDVLLR
jgi:hypothetical protein